MLVTKSLKALGLFSSSKTSSVKQKKKKEKKHFKDNANKMLRTPPTAFRHSFNTTKQKELNNSAIPLKYTNNQFVKPYFSIIPELMRKNEY